MRIEKFFKQLTILAVYAFVVFFPVSRAIIEISFVVALVSWLAGKYLRREGVSVPRDWTMLFLCGFFALTVASVFVSAYPSQSLRGLLKAAKQILFFFIVIDTFRTKDDLKKLVSFAFAVLAVMILDVLWQYGTGWDLFRHFPHSFVDTNIRLTGPFGDHGFLGTYLATWVLIALALLLIPSVTDFRRKVFLGATVLSSLFCLFHTQARGAWAAFAAGLVILFLVQGKKKYIFLLGLAAIAGYFILPRNMIVHPDAEGKEQSAVERVVLWDRAVNVIRARPLLGTGINTYVKSYHEFDKAKSWRVQNYYAHNSYLQIAAERGLPALACLLAFIACFFIRVLKVLRGDKDEEFKAFLRGWMAAVFCFLVFALVDTFYESLPMGMYFWFFFGIGYSALQIACTGRVETK